MIRKEIQHAELIHDDGIIKLVLDHDKGRTILGYSPGPPAGFFPMDEASNGALIDLYRDLQS